MSEHTAQRNTQIKLLVNTASEAVSVLREHYGQQARVLSVKQVEQGGLKRLVSKPKLEVIVEVPLSSEELEKATQRNSKAKAAATAEPDSALSEEAKSQQKARAESEESKNKTASSNGKSPIGAMYDQSIIKDSSSGYFSDMEETDTNGESANEEAQAELGTAANPVRRGTLETVRRAISMLESVGFDRSLIERVRSEVDFKNLGSLPTVDLYARICDWLCSKFPDCSNDEISARRAFIGCSGVGKTSALCKMLSSDVFVNGLAPTVLKVDSGLPNPSDGLEVFCEIVGATFVRSIDEISEIGAKTPLLVDMPGYSLSDPKSVTSCREALDELGIEERILVVNAAYEAEIIAEMLTTGEALGATRVVFTHLEETRKAGKLWKFMLNGRITPIFFSEGPNPAGEYRNDTFSYLLEKTFPNGRDVAGSAPDRGTSETPNPMPEEPVSL